MQELITRLTQKAGITTQQAATALDTIKEFVKEKFPMMAGAVDNLFAESTALTSGAAMGATAVPSPDAEPGNSVLDKISDYIPGKTGQNVEDFAKNAADKAEDFYGAAKDKLGGFIGNDKK